MNVASGHNVVQMACWSTICWTVSACHSGSFGISFVYVYLAQNVCKSCFVKLRDFRDVRRFLIHGASILVVNALVSSPLDYCNSLFRSLSMNLPKLQCILNVHPELYQTPVDTPV